MAVSTLDGQHNETCSTECHTAHCYLRWNGRRSFL